MLVSSGTIAEMWLSASTWSARCLIVHSVPVMSRTSAAIAATAARPAVHQPRCRWASPYAARVGVCRRPHPSPWRRRPVRLRRPVRGATTPGSSPVPPRRGRPVRWQARSAGCAGRHRPRPAWLPQGCLPGPPRGRLPMPTCPPPQPAGRQRRVSGSARSRPPRRRPPRPARGIGPQRRSSGRKVRETRRIRRTPREPRS